MKKLCRILSMVGVLLMLLCGAAMAESQLLALPADLTEIREEAFLNSTAFNKVSLPEGVLSIGPHAFAGSSAKEITLPRSLESIADNAFDNCDSLHLYVWRDTYAHEWCALRSIPYTVLDMTHENLLGKDYFELETYAETFGTIGVFSAPKLIRGRATTRPPFRYTMVRQPFPALRFPSIRRFPSRSMSRPRWAATHPSASSTKPVSPAILWTVSRKSPSGMPMLMPASRADSRFRSARKSPSANRCLVP